MILFLLGCPRMDGECPNPNHPGVAYYEVCPDYEYTCVPPVWEVDIRTYWGDACGCGCIKRSYALWWVEERRRRINEEWND